MISLALLLQGIINNATTRGEETQPLKANLWEQACFYHESKRINAYGRRP